MSVCLFHPYIGYTPKSKMDAGGQGFGAVQPGKVGHSVSTCIFKSVFNQLQVKIVNVYKEEHRLFHLRHKKETKRDMFVKIVTPGGPLSGNLRFIEIALILEFLLYICTLNVDVTRPIDVSAKMYL